MTADPLQAATSCANNYRRGYRARERLGTRSLTWSRGLKARYHVKEKTDAEIAAEQIGGELIAELSVDQWNLVKGEHLGTLALLEAAEDSGADGVHYWLFLAEIRRRKRDLHIARLLSAA